MKVEIPEAVKVDVPPNRWGKVLVSTPVVMAVVATALAGLASSEMTKAQYQRSLAAQQQSKAGDQWSFYQAKRLRETIQRQALDLIQDREIAEPLDPNTFTAAIVAIPGDGTTAMIRDQLVGLLRQPGGRQALDLLATGTVISPSPAPLPASITEALAALASSTNESDAIRRIDDHVLVDAMTKARQEAQDFDTITKPWLSTVSQAEGLLDHLAREPAGRALRRTFVAARLRLTANRYTAESRLNQAIANLEEVAVAQSNREAEHHRVRSGHFFIGMLAAQLGVIVATMAVAAKQRSLLWGIATAAGLVAVSFASYVYMFT